MIISNNKHLFDINYDPNNSKYADIPKSKLHQHDRSRDHNIELDLCKSIIENENIKRANAKLWNVNLDNTLHELIVVCNFNYFDICNKFHKFIIAPKRYEYTVDEIRRHWSFLYSCRLIGFKPEQTYYANLKEKYIDIKKERENNYVNSFNTQKAIFYDSDRLKDISTSNNCNNLNEEHNNSKQIKNKENILLNKNANNNTNEESSINKTNCKEIKNIKEKESDTHITQHFNKEDNSNLNSQLIMHNNTHQKVINYKENKISNNEIMKKETIIKTTKDIEESSLKVIDYKNIKEEIKLNSNSISDNNNKEASKDKNINNNYDINLNYLRNIKENFNKDFELNKENYYDNIERELNKTKNIDQLIKENETLSKENEKINNFYKFTMKEMKYLLPKMLNNDNISSDIDKSIKTSDNKNVCFNTRKKQDVSSEEINKNSLLDNTNNKINSLVQKYIEQNNKISCDNSKNLQMEISYNNNTNFSTNVLLSSTDLKDSEIKKDRYIKNNSFSDKKDIVLDQEEKNMIMMNNSSNFLDNNSKLEEYKSNFLKNEERLNLFRKFMFSSINNSDINNKDATKIKESSDNLLDNIIDLITNINSDEVKIVKSGDNNDTLDNTNDKNNISSCNNDNSLNLSNSNYLSKEFSNNNSNVKYTYYRGMPIKQFDINKNNDILDNSCNSDSYEEDI